MTHNNKKMLIVGAGGLGKATLEIAFQKFNCFFIDDCIPAGTIICGVEVIGGVKILRNLKASSYNVIVTIGDNKIRQKILTECENLGYNIANVISPLAFVSEWSQIGKGCIVFPFATIQHGAIIGNGNVICSHSEVHHDSCIGNYCVIYPNSVIRTQALLGDRIKCGSNVSIGNCAVVDSDIEIENGTCINS